MSFCLDVSSPVVRSEPCVLRAIDRLFPCWTRTCVSLWATTQVHAHAHTGLRADYTRRIDLAFSHKLIGPPCIMLSDHYYLYDHINSILILWLVTSILTPSCVCKKPVYLPCEVQVLHYLFECFTFARVSLHSHQAFILVLLFHART